MDKSSNQQQQGDAVKVALRIRPQNGREKVDMCQICTEVIPEEPQVVLGKDKAFTFDHVFDRDTLQDTIYNSCVKMLVEGCFDGYNATVFAYGQTGSGKTYTMGTGFDVDVDPYEVGIIPRAIQHLFEGIEKRKEKATLDDVPPPTFKVTVQFMELYNEEILDLLDPSKDPETRNRKSHIKVHEDASGAIYVVGVNTRPVDSFSATIQLLKGGALSRATASTKMNVQSSRSHAIFTLHIRQDRMVADIPAEDGKEEDSTQTTFETLTAKFHFVDLAGSERLKRTGATGDRAKEGISINCGLLALGNVISALGDKTKRGCHVPYRDSKLTRLLQDSLGGNSRTLMIACVSPSDRDFMETLNTLKYANRAKNIQNVVIANQDKASKLLAQLRMENSLLQKELLEYKTGKRVVDADGVEGINDLYHENNMLQSENEKLRQRIKAMSQTVECLTERNTQLITENAVCKQNYTGDTFNNEHITSMIQGYIKDAEVLRAKLTEADSLYKVAQKTAVRAQSRLALSPMAHVPMSSSFTSVPDMPEIDNYELLKEANKDLKVLKKKIKFRTGGDGQESNKENICENGDARHHEDTDDLIQQLEIISEGDAPSDEEYTAGEEMVDLDEDLDELELMGSNTDTDEEEGLGSDNIHEDLAELTCEMTLKTRLIEALEKNQNKLNAMKNHYEQKVIQLTQKIRDTELERDSVLSNIAKLEEDKKDKAKNIRDKYQRKLNELQSELKKFQEAKKDHAKLLRNQVVYERQLRTYQQDLQEMKRTKVKLMKQIKEEAEKNKANESRRHKEITQLRRERLKYEQKIKTLETEKHQKEVVLKRKQEEVEALRKRQKPMSSRAAGRVGKYDVTPTIPVGNIPGSMYERRNRMTTISDKLAKRKWDIIQKRVEDIVKKRQTLNLIEKDMETWLKERKKLGQSLEKYTNKKQNLIETGQPEETINECLDVIDSLEGQLQVCQENISEIQEQIMQLEENKNNDDVEKLQSIFSRCNMMECRYLFSHLIEMVLSKGTSCANKETELKELHAKLHQSMVNNTLQQDLLKHMMIDQIDIDMEELVQNDAELECVSSGSSSPVENMSVKQNSSPARARRRTATPMELLYSAESPDLENTLIPLMESSREEVTTPTSASDDIDFKALTKSVDTLDTMGKSSDFETCLSPVPLRRVNSASDALKPRCSSELVSPQSSPLVSRKRNNDVFKRLTSNTCTGSPDPNRGSITRVNTGGRTSPVFCSHVVEGHCKPVLSVYATERLLFTSSKDRSAKAWDLNTGLELQTFTGHPNNVVVVKYNEPTRTLFTVSQSEVKLWDIRIKSTPTCLITFHSSGLTSVPTMYQTRQGELGRGEQIINDIALTDDGNALFTAAGNMVRIWDVRSQSCVSKLTGHQAQVMVLALARREDKQIVVSGSKDHYIKVFELPDTTSTLISPTYNLEPPHYDGVQSLAMQDNNLFSGSRDRCIKKWDLNDQQMKQSVNCAHKDWICGLAVMPEHNILLSGCRSGYLKLWQIGDCSQIGEIKAHNFPITAIATNSSAIFTASNDPESSKCHIWKLREGTKVRLSV